MVREAKREELMEILELYLHLHEASIPETFRFYENAGYNRGDKTAFVQWLGELVKRRHK